MTTFVEADTACPVTLPAGGRAGVIAKRVLDVVLATVLLVLAAPLIMVLALAVKVTSPGPALFRQVRVGRSGRQFHILKLRTMVEGAEGWLDDGAAGGAGGDDEGNGNGGALRRTYLSNHYKIPADVDPRLTGLGRVLRRLSLDELPQLVNVLRGDMSLVGPRPVVPAELVLYGPTVAWYESVRPGLSGYWQVHGRSAVTGSERVALDEYYLRNWSLWLDMRILARTVVAVVARRGAG